MRDRIIRFLSRENKTSAQMAEEIGVQPSGISHILSGRNNPSLDFIMKMLNRYNYLSTEWLLFGREPMYKENTMPGLFDLSPEEPEEESGSEKGEGLPFAATEGTSPDHAHSMVSDAAISGRIKAVPASAAKGRSVDRIVLFFEDGTFEIYSQSS